MGCRKMRRRRRGIGRKKMRRKLRRRRRREWSSRISRIGGVSRIPTLITSCREMKTGRIVGIKWRIHSIRRWIIRRHVATIWDTAESLRLSWYGGWGSGRSRSACRCRRKRSQSQGF
jgi:hypothetical protein